MIIGKEHISKDLLVVAAVVETVVVGAVVVAIEIKD